MIVVWNKKSIEGLKKYDFTDPKKYEDWQKSYYWMMLCMYLSNFAVQIFIFTIFYTLTRPAVYYEVDEK